MRPYNDYTLVANGAWRLIDFKHGKIYKPGDSAFVAYADATFGESCTDTVWNTVHGLTPITLPEIDGEYDLLIYDDVTASISVATVPSIIKRVKILGGLLLTEDNVGIA